MKNENNAELNAEEPTISATPRSPFLNKCVRCKTPFKKRSDAKFCSYKCGYITLNDKQREIRRMLRPECECRYCKKKFVPKTSRPMLYCSARCKQFFADSLLDTSLGIRNCVHCGNEYQAVRVAHWYCSPKCKRDVMMICRQMGISSLTYVQKLSDEYEAERRWGKNERAEEDEDLQVERIDRMAEVQVPEAEPVAQEEPQEESSDLVRQIMEENAGTLERVAEPIEDVGILKVEEGDKPIYLEEVVRAEAQEQEDTSLEIVPEPGFLSHENGSSNNSNGTFV